MIVYLHSFDSRYAGRTFGRHIGMDVRHISVPELTDPKQIADVVVAGLKEEERSAPEGSIDLLVIVSDGGPGYFTLSGGLEDEYFWIDEERVGHFAKPFAPLLRSEKDLGEGVEIHGCCPAAAEIDIATGKASDPEAGRRFVGTLASTFGHRVKASADSGLAGIDEDYEDSLVEAWPSTDVAGEAEIRIVRDMGSVVGFGTSSRIEATASIDPGSVL
jgi:hypothetical protein